MAYSEGQDPRWITMHGRQQSWDPSHSHLRPSNNRGRMPQRYKDTYNDVDAAVVGSLEDPNAFLAQYDGTSSALLIWTIYIGQTRPQFRSIIGNIY